MSHLVLIRGLPGSGKSTIAKAFKAYIHYEADMFFLANDDGHYLFDASKLKEAHEWCLKWTAYFLQNGKNVVVSNTFTQHWEMQKYLDLCPNASIITAHGNFQNIHNVPQHVIDKMRERWEN